MQVFEDREFRPALALSYCLAGRINRLFWDVAGALLCRVEFKLQLVPRCLQASWSLNSMRQKLVLSEPQDFVVGLGMTETEISTEVPVQTIQQEWGDIKLRIGQLEVERKLLEQENKTLRNLLERAIDHRQKSHSELVLILTGLIGKLPMNDVGAIVARLVEHNNNVSHYIAALIKGTADTINIQPTILKTLEHAKKDLLAAIKPVLNELIKADTPLEPCILESLQKDPEQFFTPHVVRANRCFVKGYVPRERVLREFGEEALAFFNDVTTDAKRNPNPKKEEIALGFKPEFEALYAQNPALLPGKREDLMALFRRVQRSKPPAEEGRAQKNAFLRLSFLLELLHYYENQNTEAPDAVFAQRLPSLVEQLVLAGPQEQLDEKLLVSAEALIAHVVSTEHRLMIINNVGKGGGLAKMLKFVLRLRAEKVPASDPENVISEFVKHLIPAQKAPPAPSVAAPLRLVPPEMQLLVVHGLMDCDRLRRDEGDALGKAVAAELGVKLPERLKAESLLTPEQERQQAWSKIKDLIARRGDPSTIAAGIRDRLNAKYDADEIRQSWLTLTEADTMSLIRIFCQVPYLASGKTDPIARTVIETYVTRLTHEKYATTYNKVLNSLKGMFAAKPDSPTLLNFIALVRWVSPEAANKLSTDIGMPVPVA
jgi:hypothetical protein